MKALLGKLWQARSPRERAAVAVVAALLAAASYAWLLHAADRARGQLRASVATLRTQAALVDQQAAESERLRALPAPAASSADLRSLVQAAAEAAHLGGVLTRIDSPDADHVRIALGAAAFSDWLGLVGALQSQQVRLEEARLEALAAPGLLSVTAGFVRLSAP